jgi:hypothetical protein
MNVTLNVQSVVVELCKDGVRISTASINRLHTDLCMYQDGTLNVKGHLAGMIVQDFTDLGQVLYSQVVDIRHTEKQMVEFSYSTFLPEDNKGCDASVQLQLNGMRFFFLNRYVSELLAYLNEMNAIKENIMGPTIAAPQPQIDEPPLTVEPKKQRKYLRLHI